MTIVMCVHCRFIWDSSMYPWCAPCIENEWQPTNWRTPKHDPWLDHSTWNRYNTAFAISAWNNMGSVAHVLATYGTVAYNWQRSSYNVVAGDPNGVKTGSEAYSGGSAPVDAYLLARACNQNAHPYPIKRTDIEELFRQGILKLQRCSIPGCTDLAYPFDPLPIGRQRCVSHTKPPQARRYYPTR